MGETFPTICATVVQAAPLRDELADMPEVLSRGGSAIVSPLGDYSAGPLFGSEGILSADLDLGQVVEGRYDFDAAGHYARSDVFRLVINTRAAPPVEVLSDACPGGLSATSPGGALHAPEALPANQTAGENHNETSAPLHAATVGSEWGQDDRPQRSRR
jgi:hypothetical protein